MSFTQLIYVVIRQSVSLPIAGKDCDGSDRAEK